VSGFSREAGSYLIEMARTRFRRMTFGQKRPD
jgi:hypothetical protein